MSDSEISNQVATEFEHLLNEAMWKIRHCVGQLSDEQVWKKPDDGLNSVANLLLHLAGNLNQWCVVGILQKPDDRDRAAEFAATGGLSSNELLERLERVVEEAISVMRNLDADSLKQARQIQGFEVTVLQALFHTVPHFVGHTHQILMLTRLLLGSAYQFEWSPEQTRSGVPI
ncbi:MAG: putative damage-inducible protein DinB [Planctomycetaceae bacterium]|jgi:uncharacterized damage-inducible protein DinB